MQHSTTAEPIVLFVELSETRFMSAPIVNSLMLCLLLSNSECMQTYSNMSEKYHFVLLAGVKD